MRYAKTLVTGAAGFVGRHLLDHLLHAPDGPRRVVALDVRPGLPRERVDWVRCDLGHRDQVAAAVREAAPDSIVHLAGINSPTDYARVFDLNIAACEYLLSAAADLKPWPRVIVFGSAAEYGMIAPNQGAVTEIHPLQAQTAYGVSKVLQERWAMLYHATRSFPVICVRPFNIIGPGQPPGMVPGAFLHQLAEVLAGRADRLCVGNTTTQRDFIDARDVASAVWSLMNTDERANGQIYNISSGLPVCTAEMLAACIELGGREVSVWRDPARLTAFDTPVIVGDCSKLCDTTGWTPRVPWRRSIKDAWSEIQAGTATPKG